VRTNYRNVLAPILSTMAEPSVVARAFPGFNLEPAALFG